MVKEISYSKEKIKTEVKLAGVRMTDSFRVKGKSRNELQERSRMMKESVRR